MYSGTRENDLTKKVEKTLWVKFGVDVCFVVHNATKNKSGENFCDNWNTSWLDTRGKKTKLCVKPGSYYLAWFSSISSQRLTRQRSNFMSHQMHKETFMLAISTYRNAKRMYNGYVISVALREKNKKLKIEPKAVPLVQTAFGVKALNLLKYDSVIYINLFWVIQI